ncbi:MAG TPA: class I SAM-dependent methyltransferase [Chthoniobacterales bacterium]|nr:class I SAM-dependent methyltransferase [Chthoniobacterales bacterium]
MFKNHFSQSAAGYAAYRPTYPIELVKFLADTAAQKEFAWDCGCGSGQLSTLLAEEFTHVYATDASSKQIENASPHPQVRYACAPAETSGLDDQVADLIVAAQAAHWFDLPAFYREVRRVGRSGSVIALVSYGIVKVDEPLNSIIGRFYWDVIGAYWPPERKHVEDGYRSLEFPFAEIQTPDLAISTSWRLPDFIGYVNTWSAVAAMEQAVGPEPRERFSQELGEAWGPAEQKRTIRWPLAMRVGVVD